ncbi:MAG: Trk system potassium transporter TrkA [Alphaproteobacteria bacterium CG11_big_fil_rev_8_21_14_0_20_44_7]|nr:MAG: Trk system potassium transporter TrkA [Alphaproteobacteria bacterium CG11_big_fil_rev_8_21_14_0_20_44_7]
MRIVICGAGRVGKSIAAQLAAEHHDITIIDNDAATLGKIGSNLDVKTVLGFACHPPILQEAGADDADMIIAVTTSDEVNMIACQIGKTVFKVPTKIARIRHQNYLLPVYQDMYRADDMPVDVIISPEIEVAKNILNRFHVPGAIDTIPIENSNTKIIGVRMMSDCPFLGITVEELQKRFADLNIEIMGISRGQEIILPKPKDILIDSDEVYFVTDNKSTIPALTLLGHEEKEARKIVIIGGGNIGYYLASELEAESKSNRIKVIELNKERAEQIAEQLEKVIVINGSALDEKILEEASVATAEAVISVSNDDEVNILSALLAKTLGAKTCFTLLNNNSFVPLMHNLGIDITVNPRETTVSSILQHVRRGKIRSAHTLKDNKAEIIEAEVTESIGLAGKHLDDLTFPEGVVIGALIRDGQFQKVSPSTLLERRDRLIMMSLASEVRNVENLFSLQTRYF